MPPLVHSLLRPRSIFSGEPLPTLRSNDFAVIADLLDDVVGPVLRQTECSPKLPSTPSRRRTSGLVDFIISSTFFG